MRTIKLALAILFSIAIAACGGGGGGSSSAPVTSTPITSTATSSSSSSGAMGVYTKNGATYALTPGGATAGGTANLLTLPNSGNMVGVVTVTQVIKTPITTSLKDAYGSAATISGTSLDPANDVGMAFNYYIGKISLFKLTTATEITTFDTLTTNTIKFSGTSSVKIAGAIMNPANKTIILATADGFEVVDYSNPAAPVKVREIPSLAVNATSGVEIMENFAFDAALTKGAMIITGGGSTYKGGATGTAGPLMSLVDANTGSVYRPDTVTAALFVKSDYIDAAAVDTTYHVAILADEGIGTTLVDLNQLTLNASAGTYSLPAAAVSRITTYTKKDNLAIESTNHLVMMGAGYGGNNLVAAQLKAPSVGLGFAKEVVVTMPSDVDDLGAPVYWSGSGDPHGVGAYITPADHPTSPNTSMGMWLSGDTTHIAVIDLLGVLNGTLASGTYNPTTTKLKDIAYFKIPSGGAASVNISATATTTTAQNLTVGTAMTSFSPLTPSGGATPYTYSYTGTLPTGLSFSASTGAVTGTPTATYATSSLVFSVKDANNVVASTTSTVSFTVGVAGPISATATTTAQNLTVGTAMTSFSPLTASGGTAPYTYGYSGTLPAGLSFNASTGAVTGTPTATYATSTLIFTVQDANNVTAPTIVWVSFTVGAAVPISATATTTAQNLTVGTAMTSFSPLTASGGATPYTYGYSGTLPAGLSFTSNGVVTGTPTAAYATANLVFSVKDANNVVASTTSTVSFTVGTGTGAGTGTGVTFSGILGGYSSVADTNCTYVYPSYVCVAGAKIYTTGSLYIWSDASGAMFEMVYLSTNDTLAFFVGSSLAYGLNCGVSSSTVFPLCSSMGITFDRTVGMVTFASTPILIYSTTYTTGLTATGSLSFAPF